MIVVLASLKSANGPERDDTLCRLEICNDNTGTLAKRNYKVELFSRGKNARKIRSAVIKDWPAQSKPAWELVAEAFRVLGEV